jgi:uncharacterized membrane-anchored protein
MRSKKILLVALILVALAQLFVPAKMIWNREVVLATGTAFKFKVALIDPHDPFRGKYITLSYKENTFSATQEEDWIPGESVFVALTTDDSGFAKIKSVLKTQPSENLDFVRARLSFLTDNTSNKLIIDYPFDRYYMEESKAHEAELVFRRQQKDDGRTAVALVNVKNGDAVLKDILIDGQSIKEVVKANKKRD